MEHAEGLISINELAFPLASAGSTTRFLTKPPIVEPDGAEPPNPPAEVGPGEKRYQVVQTLCINLK